MNQDIREFFTFAYELRKQDYDNSHSMLLLTDNIQPKILVDVVMSNYWDPVACSMRCDQNKKFNILMNGINPLVYNKSQAKNINERPRIKKPGVDKRKYMEDLHFLLTSQGNV